MPAGVSSGFASGALYGIMAGVNDGYGQPLSAYDPASLCNARSPYSGGDATNATAYKGVPPQRVKRFRGSRYDDGLGAGRKFGPDLTR